MNHEQVEAMKWRPGTARPPELWATLLLIHLLLHLEKVAKNPHELQLEKLSNKEN